MFQQHKGRHGSHLFCCLSGHSRYDSGGSDALEKRFVVGNDSVGVGGGYSGIYGFLRSTGGVDGNLNLSGTDPFEFHAEFGRGPFVVDSHPGSSGEYSNYVLFRVRTCSVFSSVVVVTSSSSS
mmetsp:Transcript_32613/g.48288  ORF Transcript_32613/g.48288 Transcript_32613/m.48288 type:complete len:123 (+) Transcript_32613:594-962(+)